MPARREVLFGGAAVIAAAAIGHGPRRDETTLAMLPADVITSGHNTLILHDGGRAGIALVQAARVKAPRDQIRDQRVAVLAPHEYARTGALLERARGGVVVALLDDADALVVEALLAARAAQALTRRRYDGQMLVTARI